jgi:hypothetical protein
MSQSRVDDGRGELRGAAVALESRRVDDMRWWSRTRLLRVELTLWENTRCPDASFGIAAGVAGRLRGPPRHDPQYASPQPSTASLLIDSSYIHPA